MRTALRVPLVEVSTFGETVVMRWNLVLYLYTIASFMAFSCYSHKIPVLKMLRRTPTSSDSLHEGILLEKLLLRNKRQFDDSDRFIFRDDNDFRSDHRSSYDYENGLSSASNNNDENDFLVFEDDDSREGGSRPSYVQPTRRTSTEVPQPGQGTTQTPCEDACRTTNQYNPACGDDGVTYYNPARLSCAQYCGKHVTLSHVGRCMPLLTPVG